MLPKKIFKAKNCAPPIRFFNQVLCRDVKDKMSDKKRSKNGGKTPKTKKKNESVSKFQNPPSLVEHDNMKFLIFDSPNDDNLNDYIEVWAVFDFVLFLISNFSKVFNTHNVKTVVRVCNPTYSLETLQEKGFEVYVSKKLT